MGCLSSTTLHSLQCLALPLSRTEQVCATAKIQKLPDFTESSNAQQLIKWQSNSFLSENDTEMNEKTHLQYHLISYGHQLGAIARVVLQRPDWAFLLIYLYRRISKCTYFFSSFLLCLLNYCGMTETSKKHHRRSERSCLSTANCLHSETFWILSHRFPV